MLAWTTFNITSNIILNAQREREMCVNDLQCVRASCNKCEITRNVRKRLAELCGWFADDCGHPAESEGWFADDCGHPAESETWNAMMFRLHLMPRRMIRRWLRASCGDWNMKCDDVQITFNAPKYFPPVKAVWKRKGIVRNTFHLWKLCERGNRDCERGKGL